METLHTRERADKPSGMRVAAIIPAYNSARFLRQSIDSVLSQTCPVAEIIVVDDGSSDNTRELVLSYGDRVRYYWQENRGVSAARNHGVRQSSCPWVAFLDADDWWDANKIDLQAAAIERNSDAVLCYTSYALVSPGDVKLLFIVSDGASLWPDLRYRNPFANSSVMMRRDLFLELGGFDENNLVCQDWDLWFRAARNRKVTAVEEPVTSIRVVPGSLSRSKTERILRDMKLMIGATLVADLSGFSRWAWARRAWSAELYRCAIVERENQTAQALPLVMRSIAAWPSPFFLCARFKSLLIYWMRPKSGGPPAESP